MLLKSNLIKGSFILIVPSCNHVDFQYDGKGIDEMLVNLLGEIADNFGLRPVKLVTTTKLQRRYERLGYNLVEEVEIEEFGKQIIMDKFLD